MKNFVDYKMQEYEVDENEVTKIVTEVAIARRQVEIVRKLFSASIKKMYVLY